MRIELHLRFSLHVIASLLTFGFLAGCEDAGLPDPSAIQTDDIAKASDTGKVSRSELFCNLTLDSGSADYGVGEIVRINIEKSGNPDRLVFEEDIELAPNALSINVVAPTIDMDYVLDVIKGDKASRCQVTIEGTSAANRVDVGDDTTTAGTTGEDTNGDDTTGGETTGGVTGTDETTSGTTTMGTTTTGTTTSGTTTLGTTTFGTTTFGTTTGFPPPPIYRPSCSIRLPNRYYAGQTISATITINSDVEFGTIFMPDGMNYAVAVSGQTFQFRVPTGDFSVVAQVTAYDRITTETCRKSDEGEVKPDDQFGWCYVSGRQYSGGNCVLNCPSNMYVLTHNAFRYTHATSCASSTFNYDRSARATVPASTWQGPSEKTLCRLEVTCTAQ